MGKAQIIMTVISCIAVLLFEGVPLVLALRNKGKKLVTAQTSEERAEILADMLEKTRGFIIEAESRYSTVNNMMKNANASAGPLKKDFVISRVQMLAAQVGIDFDVAYWDKKIDELVELTKRVN